MNDHSELSPGHGAALTQLGLDVLDHIHGDGETDPHGATAAAEDGRVHSDHLPIKIDKWPAGVARVNGGVGLNEIGVIDNTDIAAAAGAYNACRDGVRQAEGVANGQYPFAHLDDVGISKPERGQAVCLDFDQRHVRFGVAADQFGFKFAAIGKLHCDLAVFEVSHDMVVRHDVPARVDDETASLAHGGFAGHLESSRRTSARLGLAAAEAPRAEEELEQIIRKAFREAFLHLGRLNFAAHLDRHHRW